MPSFAEIRKNGLHFIVLAGIFLIPLVWSRYLNANYVSAKFFLVYVISSLSLFVSSQKWLWPRLPKPLGISLIIIIFLHLLSPFISGLWVHVLYLFRFLSFVFFAYYFYSLRIDLAGFLKSKYESIFFVVVGAIFIFVCYDFYGLRIQKLDIGSEFLLGSFGNVNMLAEFLILSLPLLHFWCGTKTRIPSFFKDIFLWGWFFFILYCRSRSAWLGLGLWAVWGVFQKKISWKQVGVFVLAFVCYQVSLYAPHVENPTVAFKAQSFSQRLHLYTSTLNLIYDHPFGIGVGQYFNEIMPYLINSDFRPNEFVYFDQPHSEFLKWAVQFGWIGFVLPLMVLGYFLFYAIQKKNFFLTSSFAVLLPQLAFQFPFENPASLMFLAFLFALALRLFEHEKIFLLSVWKRVPFFVMASIGVLHGALFVTSVFLETSHNGNLSLVESTCELYPVNLNGCFVRDQFYIGTNRLLEARLALTEDFQKFPFHAGLMRIFPAFLKTKGDERKMCEAVLMYDYVYERQTFFNADVLKACGTYPRPVTHYTPEQFKDDYLKWLHSALGIHHSVAN